MIHVSRWRYIRIYLHIYYKILLKSINLKKKKWWLPLMGFIFLCLVLNPIVILNILFFFSFIEGWSSNGKFEVLQQRSLLLASKDEPRTRQSFQILDFYNCWDSTKWSEMFTILSKLMCSSSSRVTSIHACCKDGIGRLNENWYQYL